VLQWWTTGTYNNTVGTTTVTNGGVTPVTPTFNIAFGTQQLFSDTCFFPNGGSGSNDTGTFLTALFTGTANITGGSTLTFTGNVDDDVIIYYRTSGTSGPYTLLAATPTHLSNQPGFDFTSASLGTGLNDFEIFYADRSSTQAAFTLDAVVTAAVPEPSTWAMLILGGRRAWRPRLSTPPQPLVQGRLKARNLVRSISRPPGGLLILPASSHDQRSDGRR
jgi:hypothetical protein